MVVFNLWDAVVWNLGGLGRFGGENGENFNPVNLNRALETQYMEECMENDEFFII